MNAVLLAALVALLALAGLALPLLAHVRRQERLEARLQSIRRPAGQPLALAAGRGRLAGLVGALGNGLARSGLLSQKTVEGLEQTLGASGLRGPGALGVFVGAKLLLLLCLPLLTLVAAGHFGLSPLMRNLAMAGAALVGMLAPDWWVRRRHQQYLAAVQSGLADALDLMVICAEAGLGFEPAINRVAVEIRGAHPAVAAEFAQTASELRVVADSRIALANMGSRTGLDSLRRMASMLTQTMRYGTPLGDALRVLSQEMRHETLMRFETRAARLPVLLTLPMIVFILPCIFLIVGGPAAIQVTRAFSP